MRKTVLFLSMVLFLVTGCFAAKKIVQTDLSGIFAHYGVEGCFAMYDMEKDVYTVYNLERCNTGFLPASTFKIFNSLVILETGAVSNTKQVIEWDGTKYDVPEWNSDQTLESAFKVSTVWVFQKLARIVGEKDVLFYLNLADYGNKDISAGIDLFWLEGGFRITPLEQVDFLARLVKGDLPFGKDTMSKVTAMMFHEEGPGYAIYAKTGFAARVKPNIGWWVGFVDVPGNTYCFALNIQPIGNPGADFGKARIGIAKAALQKLGVLP